MGLFDSSSSSEQRQEAYNQTQSGVVTGQPGGLVIAPSNLRNLSGKIQVNTSGLSAADVAGISQSLGGAFAGVASATAAALNQATAPVANIAQTATGTQSEAGRILGQLALPALLLAGLFLFLKYGKGGK